MTEYPYNLVPKDKFDISNIDKLLLMSDDEMKLIIGDLLKWLQDMNWPVAEKVADVLSYRSNLLELYIPEILSPEQNDDCWKYWIISALIPALKDKPSLKIVRAVERIAENPTKYESNEEVNIIAYDILNELKSRK